MRIELEDLESDFKIGDKVNSINVDSQDREACTHTHANTITICILSLLSYLIGQSHQTIPENYGKVHC